MEISESTNKKTSHRTSKICMFISAICMGNVGLFITLLSGYPIYSIVLFRGIFGTLFLTLLMIRNHSFNKEFIKESFRLHWKILIIIGIINSLIIYFYFISISISGYAVAAFLLYTSGVFVILLLIITKEEKVSKINFLSFILAVIGVAIIMEFWLGIFNWGIGFGLLSGLTLAILVFCKKKIYNKRNQNPSELNSTGDFDMFLGWWPTLCLALLFLPIGASDLLRLTLLDLLFCLLLGFFPTALAFWLYNIGVKNDKGGNIVILAYFEPIMATINTIIFLKIFSIYTIIGGALVLIANFIVLKYSRES
ncbi:MAG: DMT family transporter [Promethearchaeota archaeon]